MIRCFISRSASRTTLWIFPKTNGYQDTEAITASDAKDGGIW
ncbi:hypothetical protein J2T16_004397 [Paenibacillus intestini]|nr:hypothetical protein [Paenibacillus intestini]